MDPKKRPKSCLVDLTGIFIWFPLMNIIRLGECFWIEHGP